MSDLIQEQEPIGNLVREMETAFISGTGTLTSKYVTSDLFDDISKIYAYLESKHWTGETDSLGRDKPFFNIVLAARNTYYRATDIDRSNITVLPTKSTDTVAAFLATVHLQNWMRRENFGTFLNDWGIELAGFNSSVVKFIESDGELHSMIVPWSRLICDQIDFDNNPKIEILELTEAQLYQRVKTHGYDKDMVEKLCDAVSQRELTDREKQDQKTGYIKLYEVHGFLPLSYITGEEKDDDEYVQQMHVVSFVASKEKGRYDDFTLVSGREEQDPYLLTSLLPATDGSVSLNGAVKNLFQSQWMMNHTVKSMKDQLDLASKLFFQTSDPNYVGRNVISAIEQGDIMIHAVNQPLTLVNNASHDVSTQQAFAQMWKGLSSEIVGISESMLGNAAPSGTAWRQVEALLNESHSLFELMTENKALAIETMLRRFVIPFIKKKMDTSEEITATLDAHNISKIDAMYVPRAAIAQYNKRTLDQIGAAIDNPDAPIPQPFDANAEQASVKQSLAPLGNQRFFVPSETSNKKWKDTLKDLEWELDIHITDESRNTQLVMTTLNSALVTVMNPAYPTNPQAQMIVSKILSQTGVVSPLEFAAAPAPQPLPQTTPVGGTQSGLQVQQ